MTSISTLEEAVFLTSMLPDEKSVAKEWDRSWAAHPQNRPHSAQPHGQLPHNHQRAAAESQVARNPELRRHQHNITDTFSYTTLLTVTSLYCINIAFPIVQDFPVIISI